MNDDFDYTFEITVENKYDTTSEEVYMGRVDMLPTSHIDVFEKMMFLLQFKL